MYEFEELNNFGVRLAKIMKQKLMLVNLVCP